MDETVSLIGLELRGDWPVNASSRRYPRSAMGVEGISVIRIQTRVQHFTGNQCLWRLPLFPHDTATVNFRHGDDQSRRDNQGVPPSWPSKQSPS